MGEFFPNVQTGIYGGIIVLIVIVVRLVKNLNWGYSLLFGVGYMVEFVGATILFGM